MRRGKKRRKGAAELDNKNLEEIGWGACMTLELSVATWKQEGSTTESGYYQKKKRTLEEAKKYD